MIETDNVAFECFVVTIVIIDNQVQRIITRLYKKLKDTEYAGYIFSF